ncbi:hypothetical protein BH11VER1_BH11VER1_34480 [soil metagenome]
MEMVIKKAIGIVAITLSGLMSGLAVDGVEVKAVDTSTQGIETKADASVVGSKPSDTPQAGEKIDVTPLEIVLLSKEQLKEVALKYSSRYTKTEKEEASKSIGSKLRSIDPFGLPTYPQPKEDKPEDVIETPGSATAEPEKITLGHALRTIKINGINLERAEVLFGSRNMFEGDIAEILYKGQTFMAELTEVSGFRLVFIDTKTKEEFTKSLNMLPAPNFEPSKQMDSKLSLQDKARQLESIAK